MAMEEAAQVSVRPKPCTTGQQKQTFRNSSTWLARGAPPVTMNLTLPPNRALILPKTSLSKNGEACTQSRHIIVIIVVVVVTIKMIITSVIVVVVIAIIVVIMLLTQWPAACVAMSADPQEPHCVVDQQSTTCRIDPDLASQGCLVLAKHKLVKGRGSLQPWLYVCG